MPNQNDQTAPHNRTGRRPVQRTRGLAGQRQGNRRRPGQPRPQGPDARHLAERPVRPRRAGRRDLPRPARPLRRGRRGPEDPRGPRPALRRLRPGGLRPGDGQGRHQAGSRPRRHPDRRRPGRHARPARAALRTGPAPRSCVKPVDQGSSVDVYIVPDQLPLPEAIDRLLARYGQALVERFIAGPELTVGVLGDRSCRSSRSSRSPSGPSTTTRPSTRTTTRSTWSTRPCQPTCSSGSRTCR